MRALVMPSPGGSAKGELSPAERAPPELPPGFIRVRVRAAGLNRADLLQARGLYPAPPGFPADIPGLEYAGEVLELGEGVRRFRPGDRVMGITAGGAFAAQVCVPQDAALPVPSFMSFVEAAALPEAYLTAFDALVLQGGLQRGESALILSAASGVGTAAVQIAREWGAISIGTSRSMDKVGRLKELGLTHALEVREPGELVEKIKAVSPRGIDVAIDLLGGPYALPVLKSMAPRGRVLQVGLLAGGQASVELNVLMYKRLRWMGTVLRSRPWEEKAILTRAAEAQLLPLWEQGRAKPVVDTVFPFGEVSRAFDRMAAGHHFGKIVLSQD
jgi:putative PIG3 family NAD(P)H quinone oxidoreductase